MERMTYKLAAGSSGYGAVISLARDFVRKYHPEDVLVLGGRSLRGSVEYEEGVLCALAGRDVCFDGYNEILPSHVRFKSGYDETIKILSGHK